MRRIKCAIYALLRAGVVVVLATIMPAALGFAFDAVTLDDRPEISSH
jgi:hypothetical protein